MTQKKNRPGAGDANGAAIVDANNSSTSVLLGQDGDDLLCVPSMYDGRKELVDGCRNQEIAYDDLLDYAAIVCFDDFKDCMPFDEEDYGLIKHGVVELTNWCIDAYNEGHEDPLAGPGAKRSEQFPDLKQGAEAYRNISSMQPLQIANAIMMFNHAKCIDYDTGDEDDNFLVGVYQESGPKKGTYDVSDDTIVRMIHKYDKNIKNSDVEETVRKLRVNCRHVVPCNDPDLVAVNNGIYDYGNKMLMDFDPELVFLSKSHVDYVEGAPNPVIHNDDDGTDWDVVSWVHSLAPDDPEIENLLWQLLGAIIRPNVSWNKTAWLYSTLGNNGKGTLCTLMRNLCGPKTWASIPLKNFGREFMLGPLTHVSAVITDENDTGTYIDDAAALKSIITGDPFQLNRKFLAPISIVFRGFMVQCVNEMPRLRDKSESMYRRLLIVPFNNRFEGHERKYIKDDYLYRKEVLEYVLYHVLADTDYYELDAPKACLELLDEYRETNDPLRQFANEIFDKVTWTLLPNQFLYDLYRHWFQRNVPSGKSIGKNTFLKEIEPFASEHGWVQVGKKISADNRMDKPELLICEYDVTEWMNKFYRGTDPDVICMPDVTGKRYRGFVPVGAPSDADEAAEAAAQLTPADDAKGGDAGADTDSDSSNDDKE